MPIRIGINGCGRIGKLLVRLLSSSSDFEIIAINDPMPSAILINLLRYDSLHGQFGNIHLIEENLIALDSHKVVLLHEQLPEAIPWGEYAIDCVLEASGKFVTYSELEKHIESGAKKVILCQPANDKLDCTVVMGVNEKLLKAEHSIISNASCTTNCIAPILEILNTHFGIDKAFFNTVHPYTNNQSLHDGPHSDPRRSRAALCNIIPTTSSAVGSLQKVMPEFIGRVDGFATRVPVPLGAYIEISALLNTNVTVDRINRVVNDESAGRMKGIVQYCSDPIVLTDIVGNSHSAIFDSLCTKVIGENFVQILAWYDNESGYSHRVVDLLSYLYYHQNIP
jgi:glyceraldehyde 3-phosphate dehydrogenase